MQYKNLTLIGSSHIAKESVQEVRRFVEEHKPGIIAIELDKKRLPALFSKNKPKLSIYDIQRIGFKGYLFSLLGAWASKKLGKMVGVTPGSEMKEAVRQAKATGARLALIDRDIEKTLKRFSKALTWREKWHIVQDIFRSFKKDQKIPFDIRTVPKKELIEKMIGEVRDRYPSIYKVLITERNRIMAARLQTIIEKYPDTKILAVVGAGHEEGMMRLLKGKTLTSVNT